MKKLLYFMMAMAGMLLPLTSCSDDEPDMPKEPKDVMDNFEIKSIPFEGNSLPEGFLGFIIQEPKIYIYNKKGENLLDRNLATNVRDNNFYFEVGDTILKLNDRTLLDNTHGINGWFEFYPGFTPVEAYNDSYDDVIYIGRTHPGEYDNPKSYTSDHPHDSSIVLVWPERNLRFTIRTVQKIWSADGYCYWQGGMLLDGKPGDWDSVKIVVD